MAKRPSYISIRARQRNIIEGLETKDLTIAEGAKKFGVTPAQLKRFTETNPRKLSRSFRRSPGTRGLYYVGERKSVRSIVGAKSLYRLEYQESRIRDIQEDLRTGVRRAGFPTRAERLAAIKSGEPVRLGFRELSEKERAHLQRRIRGGERIQPLFTGHDLPRNLWARWTNTRNYPSSIKAIRLLHRNNRISDRAYINSVAVWQQIYNIDDDYASDFYDEVEDYEEYASG
jgi:hypothetical protein